MNKLNINACPLCQESHLSFVMKCKDHYASKEEFEIWKCDGCGFTFTQNAPLEADMARYYETTEYVSHSDTKKGITNKLYHTIRSVMLERKADLITHTLGKSTGRLLDIGTGTGYFPDTMQKKGWEVEAIEKNPTARQFAKDSFGLSVHEEATLWDLPAKSFDVITLWHVMEHLEHLNKTWAQLYELLSDNGVLVIAVPNCSSYDARKYKTNWAAYDVPRHLWHFTPSTIQQFGKKHGFILCAQHPMPFDAFYVSILSEKYKKSFFPFIKGGTLGSITWLRSQTKKERSSSIIYIFRKKADEEK